MFSDVEDKLKKKNKLLFTRDSASLRELLGLLEQLEHRRLIQWALDCAQKPLERFEEKYPDERRPRIAMRKCEAWAKGQIKMPEAKRAILDAHAAAKDIDDAPYQALCHAVGQAGAAVHVATHAQGLVFYELTAIVLENLNCYDDPVRDKLNFYGQRLLYWQEYVDDIAVTWAGFLQSDK